MNRMFKNVFMFTKNFSISAKNKMNNCEDITLENVKQPKIKSEEEILQMICVKTREFEELIKTQSPERENICKEINMLDSKLRKSFGFREDEDLTCFPMFKFDEPEIDGQLD